jgi:hypothetical protein
MLNVTSERGSHHRPTTRQPSWCDLQEAKEFNSLNCSTPDSIIKDCLANSTIFGSRAMRVAWQTSAYRGGGLGFLHLIVVIIYKAIHHNELFTYVILTFILPTEN